MEATPIPLNEYTTCLESKVKKHNERVQEIAKMTVRANESYDDGLNVHGEEHPFVKARKMRLEVLVKVMKILDPENELDI